MDTKVKVFQGNQIGGCVTVITHTDNDKNVSRIMIDYGSSLPGSDIKKEFEYPWESEPVDAVFFTHYHGDHVGRILEIPSEVPIYLGSSAKEIMLNIHGALKEHADDKEIHQKIYDLLNNEQRVHVFEKEDKHYKAINIKDFKIEPYSVDHSAYDAYMFLVEASDDTKESGKKVILHTGDFRGHGRRGKAMIPVINKYVHAKGREVDVLVIEGTMMSRLSEEVKTEVLMQQEATEFLKQHKYAFLICSSTNLDSLASFYQGYRCANNLKEGYMYVYSEYYKTQLETFDKYAGSYTDAYKFKNIHRLNLEKVLTSKHWEHDKTQRELMAEKGFIATIKPEDFCEDYIDAFIEDYRTGVIDQMPVIIYSMWDGYIKDTPDNKAKNEVWISFLNRQKDKGVLVQSMHTSGHASAKMIEAVINAVNPKEEIIPMHTEHPEEFLKLKICDELKIRIRTMELDVAKTKEDIDCRALKKDFLDQFKTGGKLHKFIELVEKHSDLAFCFRGNSKPEKVIIYKNNHAMFTITNSTVTFNPNYLRYCDDWNDRRLKKLYDFGYCKEKKLELGQVKTTNMGCSCSFKTSPVCSAKITSEYLDRLEEIYEEFAEIFDIYFSEKEYQEDQFLLSKGVKREKCLNKKTKTEKIRQQQLFKCMRESKNGYFFYDLEFQQKHQNKAEQDQDKDEGLSNKPDMQAIRFNEKGDAEAIVFVEVKCKKSAYGGKSSLEKHIKSMDKYPEYRLESRRREAFLLMKQYEELGLDHYEKPLDINIFMNLPLETLLVFTDDAIKNWKEDTSDIVKSIKAEQKDGIGEVILLDDQKEAILVSYK